MKTVALILVGLVVAPATASCPRFTVYNPSCSAGIFTESSLTASCSDDDTISISGTVVAGNDFDGDASVTLVPCVMGWCFKDYTQDAGDICKLISNSEGDDCGTAGTYDVEKEFTIPESAQRSSMVMGMVTIKVLVNNEDACSQTAQANSSGGYMMMGVASLFLVSGVSFLMRRHRRRPLLVLEGANDSFVEMNDIPSAMV